MSGAGKIVPPKTTFSEGIATDLWNVRDSAVLTALTVHGSQHMKSGRWCRVRYQTERGILGYGLV